MCQKQLSYKRKMPMRLRRTRHRRFIAAEQLSHLLDMLLSLPVIRIFCDRLQPLFLTCFAGSSSVYGLVLPGIIRALTPFPFVIPALKQSAGFSLSCLFWISYRSLRSGSAFMNIRLLWSPREMLKHGSGVLLIMPNILLSAGRSGKELLSRFRERQ